MSKMDIEIIVPARADETDPLEHGLIALTEAIHQLDPDRVAHGFLGGEFGYGADYENDVFVMRPFYWGDCDCGLGEREEWWNDRNHHAETCYQIALSKREKEAGLSYIDHGKHEFVSVDGSMSYDETTKIQDGIYADLGSEFGVDPRLGAAIHCTCGYQERWEEYIAVNGHRETCAVILPNFRHKRTGLEVRWYKWIGRDTEVSDGDGDYQAVFAECLSSLKR
jgi:hypothetical protein